MATNSSLYKIQKGIRLLLLSVLFHATAFCQYPTAAYSFAINTKGVNYTDKLFATEQNQQSFAHREAAFYFEGSIYLQQFAAEKNTLFFTVAIAPSRYQITGAGSSSYADTVGLCQPFIMSSSGGKINRLWLHNSISPGISTSIRTLLSYMQCQHPVGSTKMIEMVEDDPYGHCNISYTYYNQKKGIDSIVKEKKIYLQKKEEYDFNELKTTYTPISKINIRWNKDNIFPEWIDGTDKIITKLSQKTIGESETNYWIHKKELANDSLVQLHFLEKIDTTNNYWPTPLYVYINSKDFRKNIRKEILGTDSLQLLIAKLHSPFADAERDSMVLKLKSLATVYPGTAYELASILDTAMARGKVYNILSAALLDAETDNAMNALAALAWKHKEDWNYSKGLITNIGLNPQVTDSVISFFKSFAAYNPMSKTSRAAWMALGSMTDNICKKDAASGQLLWRWICDSIQLLNTHPEATRIKLLVWGNSNQLAAFDSVKKYVVNENEELRSVAVVCAGQFSSTQKNDLLLNVIKTDTSMPIRSNAARALSGQLATSFELDDVKQMLSIEKDSSIRQSLLEAIDIKSSEKKLIMQMLQQAKEKDTSLTVRLFATDMLRRIQESYYNQPRQ
jgi:hypothetical protein